MTASPVPKSRVTKQRLAAKGKSSTPLVAVDHIEASDNRLRRLRPQVVEELAESKHLVDRKGRVVPYRHPARRRVTTIVAASLVFLYSALTIGAMSVDVPTRTVREACGIGYSLKVADAMTARLPNDPASSLPRS